MTFDDNTDREALAKVIGENSPIESDDQLAAVILAVLPSLGWVKADNRTDQELADAYLGRPASINTDHVRRLRVVVGSATPEEEP